MSEENQQEPTVADQDLGLASAVHENIASSKEIISIFEKTLQDSEVDVFSTPREIVEALKAVLEMNVTLITNLFEENQQFWEQTQRWAKIRSGFHKEDEEP